MFISYAANRACFNGSLTEPIRLTPSVNRALAIAPLSPTTHIEMFSTAKESHARSSFVSRCGAK